MPAAYLKAAQTPSSSRTEGDFYRAASCTGKTPFRSWALATFVRDRKSRSGSAYRCTFCGKWHLGQTPDVIRDTRNDPS